MISAGLVCLIAGLIVFYVITDNMLAYMCGLFAIFFGALMAGFSLVALAVTLTVWAIKKSKNQNKIDNGEDNGR